MFGDGNLPVTGGVTLTALVYGAISLFVTGPLIGERMIAKSGWEEQCRSGLVEAVRAEQRASVPTLPNLDCNSLFGSMFGAEGSAFCRKHGGDFSLPFADQLQAQKRRADDLVRRKLEGAAAQAGSRCSCAIAKTLTDERVPLAISAGSLRLVVPREVSDGLSVGLQTALGSRQCQMKG